MTPREVASGIRYKPDWRCRVARNIGGEGSLLWWEFMAENVVTGEREIMVSRRWWLEPEAQEEAIVRLALEAAIRAEEHEAREWFTYRGVRVFDPHKAQL